MKKKFPWQNRWWKKQQKKEPRYFCLNCYTLFRTGKYDRRDWDEYDDVCPHCGAPGETLKSLAEEYKDLCHDYKNLEDELKAKGIKNDKSK